MYKVNARKLRDDRQGHTAETARFTGYLLDRPKVGFGLVIFRETNGRMVTTAIQRVLGEDDRMYVQTENSLYQIEIVERVQSPPSRQAAAAASW